MALRSILDIEVNDASFKEYQRSFEKYQAATKRMPEEWRAAGKVIEGSRKSFDALVASMIATATYAKQHAAAQKEADRLTKSMADRWRDIARSAKEFSGHIVTAVTSFARLAERIGIFGLLGGGAGLFGLDLLAATVSSQRRGALGLGVGYGQQASFGLNYGRYVNAPAMLGNVAGALYNNTSPGYVGLLGAGLSQQYLGTHNAADVAVELLHRLPDLFKGTPRGLVGPRISALHLDEILSQEDVVRYLNASPAERRKQEQDYRGDVGPLGLDADTQRKWQDFLKQLDLAGLEIQNVFVKGLTPLLDPLNKLSAEFEKAVSAFLGSEAVREGIQKLTDGLGWLSDYFASPKFKQDLQDVATGIGRLAESIANALKFLGIIPDRVQPNSQGVISGGAPSRNYRIFHRPISRRSLTGTHGVDEVPHPERGYWWQSGAATTGTDTGFDNLVGMVRGLEGSGDNAVSPAGARGRWQIMPATAQAYGYDPDQLFDPAYNERAARTILADLVRRYHGNTDEVLAAYNAGPGRANIFRARGDDTSVLPGETQAYIARAHRMSTYTPDMYQNSGPQPQVTIHDSTGANVNITGSQVAY